MKRAFALLPVAAFVVSGCGGSGPKPAGVGWVTTSIGRGVGSVSALVEQPDGKLVAAGSGAIMGHGFNIKGAYFALVRYNPDGSLDTSFGSGGKVTTPMGRLGSVSH